MQDIAQHSHHLLILGYWNLNISCVRYVRNKTFPGCCWWNIQNFLINIYYFAASVEWSEVFIWAEVKSIGLGTHIIGIYFVATSQIYIVMWCLWKRHIKIKLVKGARRSLPYTEQVRNKLIRIRYWKVCDGCEKRC